MVETISRPFVDTLVEQASPEQSVPTVMQPNGGSVSELTSYLANLGLEDAHLAKVISLLDGTQGDVAEMWTAPEEAQQNIPQQAPFQSAQSTSLDQASRSGDQPADAGQPRQPAAGNAKKTITIYVAEEQQILSEAYRSFFSTQSGIEVLHPHRIQDHCRLRPAGTILSFTTTSAPFVASQSGAGEGYPSYRTVTYTIQWLHCTTVANRA